MIVPISQAGDYGWERPVSEQHYSWEPKDGNGSDDCRWKKGSAECGRFIAWNITHPQQGIFIPRTPTLAWTPLTGTGPSGKSQLSKPTYCVMPLLLNVQDRPVRTDKRQAGGCRGLGGLSG